MSEDTAEAIHHDDAGVSCRWLVLICILGAALSLSRHIPFAGDPFATGFESVNSGRYSGIIQRNYLRGGFLELKGRPLLRAHALENAMGSTYSNHPPLVRWAEYGMVRILGLNEAGIRAFPTLCCALTAFLLCLVAGRAGGLWAAGTVAVSFAAMPMGFFYGRMANYESPLLMTGVLAGLLLLRERRSTAALVLGAVVVCLGMLFDWVAVFFLPAFLLAEMVAFRRRPRLSTATSIGIGIFAGGLIYGVILAWWEGGIDEAWLSLVKAQGQGVSSKLGFMEFLKAQAAHFVDNFGWVATVLTLWAVLQAMMRGSREMAPVRAHILAWMVVGILNVAVFKGRSDTHDFFWYYAYPSAVLACSMAAMFLARRSRGMAAALVVVIAFSSAWVIPSRYEQETSGGNRAFAEKCNELFGEETIILMEESADAWAFYAKAFVYDVFPPDASIIKGVELLKSGDLGFSRLAVYYPLTTQQTRPELRDLLKDEGLTEIELAGGNYVLIYERSSKDD